MDEDLQRQHTLNRRFWGSTLLATGTLVLVLCVGLAVLAMVFLSALPGAAK
jgi:hypothetical protein